MKRLMLLCASLCTVAFVVPAKPVHAQNLAWVSPNGNDSNTCSQTSPCATFAGAIAKGGIAQINCLGSGNYGALNSTTVSITDSIIIDCGDGNVGEMTTNGGSAAVNINSSDANAVIVLRHLSLNGGDNTGVNGINTQAFPAGTLIVENCVIHGFHYSSPNGVTGNGIYFAPTSGRALLQVSDSLFYDNNYNQLEVNPSSGVIASVVLNRDEFTANPGADAYGIFLEGAGTIAGTMRESVVAENGVDGISAIASAVYFTIEESSIVDNLGVGIYGGSSGAHLNVGASTIGGNGTGVLAFSGSIISFGNNQMSANGTNGTFTSTTPLQ
ncbi:MAG: hypothetical protein ABSG53_21750 [Thermoguttaceae bacterium]|jgi:hypothetical protein